MKRPSSHLHQTGAIDIDQAMTPMIDVVFLLLVFFVWTASFQIIEQILPGELSSQIGSQPSTPTPPPVKDFEDIIITVFYDGQNPAWTLNQQPINRITEIQRRLSAIASVNAAAPVILHPQPNVPLEFVIQSYDAAKLSGFTKVAFAVNPTVNSTP